MGTSSSAAVPALYSILTRDALGSDTVLMHIYIGRIDILNSYYVYCDISNLYIQYFMTNCLTLSCIIMVAGFTVLQL